MAFEPSFLEVTGLWFDLVTRYSSLFAGALYLDVFE
jgi:hypothetical protein